MLPTPLLLPAVWPNSPPDLAALASKLLLLPLMPNIPPPPANILPLLLDVAPAELPAVLPTNPAELAALAPKLLLLPPPKFPPPPPADIPLLDILLCGDCKVPGGTEILRLIVISNGRTLNCALERRLLSSELVFCSMSKRNSPLLEIEVTTSPT